MPTEYCRLVDRDDELALLKATYQSVVRGNPATIVIAGEAGIGKTRLVDELAADLAKQDALTVVGTCSPIIGGRIPYGPIVDLLQNMMRQVILDRDEAFNQIRRSISPLIGEDAAISIPTPPDLTSSARLFAGFAELLVLVSYQRPLIVVVEDFHWADPASADIIGFLARRLRSERVLLVLTVRTPLPRRAPARATLGEIRRLVRTIEIDLNPLTEHGLDAILSELNITPSPPVRDRIITVCDGNPFLAIHFALHGSEHSVSPGLRDLLLSSIDDLEPSQRTALGFLAVAGDLPPSIAPDLIEKVFIDFDGTIRELISRGLIRLSADGRIGFRHALLREVVLEDLLPSERVVAHSRAADWLLPSVGRDLGRSGEIAYHLLGGGRNPEAIRFAIRGARQASSVWAFADARELYAAVRRLWFVVEDPEVTVGISFAALLHEAALVSRWCGKLEESLQMLQEASDLPRLTPHDRARIEHARGTVLWATGDFHGSLRAYECADALLEEAPDDRLRASVLAAQAHGFLATGHAQEALTTAESAVIVATAVGAVRDRLHAAITAAAALAPLGNVERAATDLFDCLRQARELDDLELVARCYGNLTYAVGIAGRPEEVAKIAAEGTAFCRRYGPVVSIASSLMSNYVDALYVLGRWDEAVSVAHEALADTTSHSVATDLHSTLATIAARRGDAEQASREIEMATDRLQMADSFKNESIRMAQAELALLRNEWETTIELVAHDLPALEERDDDVMLLEASWLGLRAIAERAEATPRYRERSVDEQTGYVMRVAADAAARDVIPGAIGLGLICLAERARVTASDTAEQWAEAASACAGASDAYGRAYCLVRLGSSYLDRRLLRGAEDALRIGMRLCQDLGAKPLIDEVSRLVTIGRIHVGPLPPPAEATPAAPYGLTRRELDVVRLLVKGCTNRQIARTLFISERTAAVHVSNIIRKLGVGNRTAAAQMSARLGLDT